jgi:hypothetical protein
LVVFLGARYVRPAIAARGHDDMTNPCTSTTRVGLVALLIGASLAGCGDDRNPGGGSLTEDNAANKIAVAACATAFRCCEPGAEVDAFLDDVDGTTEANCRTALEARLRSNYAELTPNIAAGTVFFDPAAGERCLSALSSTGCGNALEENPGIGDCGRVYSGTRALGESCTTSEDCAQPDDGDHYCSGVCMLGMTSVGLGESCDESTTYCSDGRCEDGTCVARSAVGAACISSRDCTTLICNASLCVNSPSLALGATCSENAECASEECGCADDECTAFVCTVPLCDGV